MAKSTFRFVAPYARRLPDPIFQGTPSVERHVLLVPVRAVPVGLPFDPNARIPNVRRRIYQQVEKSLLNKDTIPGTFHLKHKGITLIASAVTKDGEDGAYAVTFEEGQGVVDGGHTLELITSNLKNEELPEQQFVKFEILTGIPNEWIVEIAGGLNTSVQVQPADLDNLARRFQWIKDELQEESYFKVIAWRENEDGELDARDVIALLTCFNIDGFPNDANNGEAPVIAYEKKSKALELFEQKPVTYEHLRPILKDILVLHDTIRYESQRFYNEAGGKYGNLAFVESKTRGEFTFPFIQKKNKYRLMNGALYPMLGAFRWMVEKDRSGKARWRGGFRNVLRLWEATASDLLRATVQTSNELGRNPNAIGKSRNHWSNLYTRVALRDLQSKVETK